MNETRYKHGCLLACSFQMSEVMDNARIKIPEMIEWIKSAIESAEETTQNVINVTKTVRDCEKKVKNVTDECEVGWELGKCLQLLLSN